MTGRAPKTCMEIVDKPYGRGPCQRPTTDGKPRCDEHTKPLDSYRRAGIDRARRIKRLTEAEKQWVRERDFHTCRECGKPGHEVDHITPTKDGGDNRPSNLQTLCTPCHDTKTRREAQDATEAAYEANGIAPQHRGSSRAQAKRRARRQGFYVQ